MDLNECGHGESDGMLSATFHTFLIHQVVKLVCYIPYVAARITKAGRYISCIL
jgi:hypothetical protein